MSMIAKSRRNGNIIKLYRQGRTNNRERLSLAQIGKRYKISRQRVHQIVKAAGELSTAHRLDRVYVPAHTDISEI